jgi:hypothetical protein
MAAITLDALPLDGVGLAQSRRRAPVAGPFDPFGFSWPLAVSLRKPPFIGLDCLGFPWILSCESILFNRLRGLKRGNFFLSPFPWR